MPPTLLGNDVVDLAEPGAAGKAGDSRFLHRVFTPAEREWIAASPRPDHALWRLWAAKEAAYKARGRQVPGLLFAHSRFEVDPDAGRVITPAGACPVEWHEGPGWVHCLAREGAGRLRWRVEALEGPPSPGVRTLAAGLLAESGLAGARIVRDEFAPGRFGPPQVVLRGRILEEVLVSLSHDGRWGAAALAL